MSTLAIGDTIPRTGYDPRGLAWDGTYWWNGHHITGTDEVHKVNSDGDIIASWSLYDNPSYPNNADGLAYDGEDIWCNDSGDAKVRRYGIGGAVELTWDAPEVFGRGITWDGTYLWAAYYNTKTIYKLQTDGTEVLHFSVSESPWGLTYYDGYLWYAYDKFVQIELDGTEVEQWALPAGIGTVGTGLTWDGSHFWLADPTNEQICQLIFIHEAKDYIAMSTDPMGTTWYTWLSGNDLKVNRLTSNTPSGGTAVTVDSSGDYDSVADVQYRGSLLCVIARKSADEKPYAFQSIDMGANWTGPTDIS